MTDAPSVDLVLPAGYDDPARASGGNRYDRHLRAGLDDLGWSVDVHEIRGAWPVGGASVAAEVAPALARVPDGRLVIVDGLVAAAAEPALIAQSGRLRIVPLVHMPELPGGPSGDVVRAAYQVIVTSAATGRVLVADHGLEDRRLIVAPPGVESAELAPGTPSGRELLCVAAVVEPKGHDVLVAALTRVAAVAPWRCVCVGDLGRDPVFVERVRGAVAAAGLADRIRFAGSLMGADLDRAYAAADVVLVPSRHESYGMVVTEALARGLPVIGSEVGGVPEALGHATDGTRPGVLVRPGDPAGLGSAIASWLGEVSLRERLRAAARDRRVLLAAWSRTVLTIATALSGDVG